jgi:hypothetical protein
MPFYVAQEKGFYKKYNIESEYIQMATGIQPQAVVAGNINYFTSVSAGISAAVAGLPLAIVISFCDTSPWVLVTQKDISKAQDLIGKTVALSGLRSSPYYFFQAFLKKFEISEKDDDAAEGARIRECLLLLDQPAIALDFLALASRLIADELLFIPPHERQRSRAVIARASGILVEMRQDSGQLVDRAAETLPVLLRKLRHLRQGHPGSQGDHEGDGAKEHRQGGLRTLFLPRMSVQ